MLMRRRCLTARAVALAAGVVLMIGLAAPVSAAAAPTGSAAAAQPAGKPAKPTKPPKPPKGKPPKGAGAPAPVDISSSMPQTMRDDLTGDFLGRGYDQRMRAEDTNLNIYDAPALGGKQLRSTPTDLGLTPDPVTYPCGINGSQICNSHLWAQYGQASTNSCSGCFQAFWNVFHLNTIYLARNGQNLFMTGTKGNSTISGSSQYQNLLYVLPPDGSCASAGCAEATVSLPNIFNQCGSCVGEVRTIGVTALAAGNVGGTPYLAVGLSDDGVQIYNVSNPSSPQLTDTFVGTATGDGSQAPPTALAWDPSGSGLLAIGVISWADEGFFVNINSNGKVQGSWLAWNQHGGDGLVPAPFSVAFGQGGVDGKVVAFGMREGDGSGTLRLVDPTVSGAETGQVAGTTDPGPNGAIIAVNPIPRFDGTAGGSDFAVSYQTQSAPAFGGEGGLLRRDGPEGDDLTALPVIAGASNANTVAPDWDTFRKWYPGIKEGRFQVTNTSAEPMTVALKASPNPGSGCWYAPSWADAQAFPAGGISVPGGQTSAVFPMGAYTAGSGGGCAVDPTTNPANTTGTWRGYLVITPVNHPADARLVGLRLNRDGLTVDVTDQAGGATTASIAYTGNHLAAFGLWNITVATPAAPTPVGSPTVIAARVTPAVVTANSPVYRFDVTGATYSLPTPYPNQLVVPPLIVQGFNGTSWTTLGTLIPATEPTITGSTLTLGPATFWWENPTGAGQPTYQQIRVSLGPAGTPTTPVTLASLTAPPDPTNVSGPQIAATGTLQNAEPVDSGLDQAPLSVQVLSEINGATGPALPSDDPSYQRIYYRDSALNLITNLHLTGADPNNFIGVSPNAGAYPNNGSVTATLGTSHYVSTTSTGVQHITGYIDGATAPSSPITVLGLQISIATGVTTAASGISLTCQVVSTGAASQCPLYPISPSQPALYLDTKNGLQIGLLTAAVATTSTQILPLQQTAGQPDHLLASTTLNQTTNPNAPTLTNPSAFLTTDSVDTTLATHGQLHTITNLQVG